MNAPTQPNYVMLTFPSREAEEVVTPALIAAGVDRISAEKASMLPPGAKITGVVATMPNGTRCIIELGAVRWLGPDDFDRLMHPRPSFGVADW